MIAPPFGICGTAALTSQNTAEPPNAPPHNPNGASPDSEGPAISEAAGEKRGRITGHRVQQTGNEMMPVFTQELHDFLRDHSLRRKKATPSTRRTRRTMPTTSTIPPIIRNFLTTFSVG